jgi:hypothetical protein
MNTLDSKRFGFGVGSAFVLINIGCGLVRLVLPKDAAIWFFNSFAHVDWTSITRWTISPWEWVIGTIEVFILGWLAGFVIAAVYNWTGRLCDAISVPKGISPELARTGKLSVLVLAIIFAGGSIARADQSEADHAAHHPKQEAKALPAPAAPATAPSETVEQLRAKIAKLEAQLKQQPGGMGGGGGMGMGMMMGGGKEGGGMGMKGMGMMGGMGGKDSPQGAGMCCCKCDGAMMMMNEQRQAPTTQPQHSHDHK